MAPAAPGRRCDGRRAGDSARAARSRAILHRADRVFAARPRVLHRRCGARRVRACDQVRELPVPSLGVAHDAHGADLGTKADAADPRRDRGPARPAASLDPHGDEAIHRPHSRRSVRAAPSPRSDGDESNRLSPNFPSPRARCDRLLRGPAVECLPRENGVLSGGRLRAYRAGPPVAIATFPGLLVTLRSLAIAARDLWVLLILRQEAQPPPCGEGVQRRGSRGVAMHGVSNFRTHSPPVTMRPPDSLPKAPLRARAGRPLDGRVRR